jgi:protein tyrosine kinase modulator
MSVAMDSVASGSPLRDEGMGFGEYFAVLKRRRRLMLMVALPIVIIAVLLAMTLPNVYRSTAVIQIEEAENLKNVADRDTQDTRYADQYVQTLSTRVLSDKNLVGMLEGMKLYPQQDDDLAATLQRLHKDISVDIVTMPILDPNTGRSRDIINAFSVSLDNRKPELAQQGAQWLVRSFLDQNRLDRQTQAASAAKFFGSEAQRMRDRVNKLEARLAEFKAKNAGQLPELTGSNLNVMDRTERDIQDIETQIQALRRERVFLVAQLNQAKSVGPETTSIAQLQAEYDRKRATYSENHPDVVALRRQIEQMRAGGSASGMTLQQQLQNQRSILAEVRQRYSEDHPDVKRIERNIAALQARISSGETADRSAAADSPVSVQLQTQLNAADTQIAALEARNAELRAKMSDLESKLSVAPQVEREYQEVTRDLTSARTKYEELVKRQMDAEVSEAAIAGGTSDKFKVISSPKTPADPAQPKRIAIVVVGLVFAVIAALSGAIAAQIFDPNVRGARDIEAVLDVSPLIAVPVIESSRTAAARKRHMTLVLAATAGFVAAAYGLLHLFLS